MAREVVKSCILFRGIFCYSGVSNVHIFIISMVDLAYVIVCCILLILLSNLDGSLFFFVLIDGNRGFLGTS